MDLNDTLSSFLASHIVLKTRQAACFYNCLLLLLLVCNCCIKNSCNDILQFNYRLTDDEEDDELKYNQPFLAAVITVIFRETFSL